MMGQKNTQTVKCEPDFGMKSSTFSFVGSGADIIRFCLRFKHHDAPRETFMDTLLVKFTEVHDRGSN